MKSAVRLVACSAAIIFALCSVGGLNATPVSGRLIMNGTTLAGVDLNTIDFNYPGCPTATNPALCPPGSPVPTDTTFGTFQVGFGSTGSFAPYINSNGQVKSVSRTDAPVNTTVAYDNFVLLPVAPPVTAVPTIKFILTLVHQGSFIFNASNCPSGAPAPGQICTPVIPGGSPLELSNSAGANGGINSHAQFSVDVTAVNLATGETTPGTGTFSTDFSGLSYQQLLGNVLNGGVDTSGYHGDFTITLTFVPEPSTLSLGLLGGLSIAVGLFRRRKTVL
jgi:hypothetical protein